jgi:hypothetical protein
MFLTIVYPHTSRPAHSRRVLASVHRSKKNQTNKHANVVENEGVTAPKANKANPITTTTTTEPLLHQTQTNGSHHLTHKSTPSLRSTAHRRFALAFVPDIFVQSNTVSSMPHQNSSNGWYTAATSSYRGDTAVMDHSPSGRRDPILSAILITLRCSSVWPPRRYPK